MKPLTTFLVAGTIAFAQTTAKGASGAPKKPATMKAAAASGPSSNKAMTIPAGAKENPNGTYSYTDKDGKKWVYSRTPFGVMRSADPSMPPSSTYPRLTDLGDTVKVETPTPFGTITATKKKSELTDEERARLAAQSAKQ